MKGRVHSIDTFSTLDGPGIRTVIFMQGCALHCKYCHNPDTWDCESKIAREYTVDEIMQLLQRSQPYFIASGGGVTFSGGEPLLQAEFIREVFTFCREEKINTAIDSSLYISSEKLRLVLAYTDLVLADIKHMENTLSRFITGAGNSANLRNLELISREGIPVWIRYVIVPGITDQPEHLQAMAVLAGSLSSVNRIDLLPYHALGAHKWELLGLDYELADIDPPSPEQMKSLRQLVAAASHKPVY